jgi:hypothetical protein
MNVGIGGVDDTGYSLPVSSKLGMATHMLTVLLYSNNEITSIRFVFYELNQY